MKGQVTRLFPIPVGRYELNMTQSQRDFISGLERIPNQNNQTSLDDQVLWREPLTTFNAILKACLDDFFNYVYAANDSVGIKINSSWVNWSEMGESHHRHFHFNSFISGVYYIQTTPDDSINFYRQQPTSPSLKIGDFGEFAQDKVQLPAIQNTLYLFPSFIHHDVPTIQTDHTRISLAFNAWPVGVFGDPLTKTALELA